MQNNLLRSASKNSIKTGLSGQFLLFCWVLFIILIRRDVSLHCWQTAETMGVWERHSKAPVPLKKNIKNKKGTRLFGVSKQWRLLGTTFYKII